MNKTSIVTGGGSGLGLEFVKLLLNDDFYVIVIDLMIIFKFIIY